MSFLKTVIGLVGGATLGLLFAPKEGKKLRDSLRGKSGADIAETLGKELGKAGKSLIDALEELSEDDRVKALAAMGKERLENALKLAKLEMAPVQKRAKKAVEKAASQVSDEMKSVKKRVEKTAKTAAKRAKKAVDAIGS